MQNSFFHISVDETRISIKFRYLQKIVIHVGIIIIFLVLWMVLVLVSTLNLWNVIIFIISLGFGLFINLFLLFSIAFSVHPVVLDIETELFYNLNHSTPFNKIKEFHIIQTATELLSGSGQYCGLRVKNIELKEKSMLFGRYFRNCQLIAQLGRLLHKIFEIHGLNISYNPKEREFDNNFEHLPTIDL